MQEKKYQIIKIQVPEAGASVKFSAETEKLYKKATGLFGSLPEEAALKGTTLELRIADKEYFPEGFEIRMIATSQSVSPNDRFYKIDEEAAGNRVEGRFTDGANANSYPYTAKLYLRLEGRSQ